MPRYLDEMKTGAQFHSLLQTLALIAALDPDSSSPSPDETTTTFSPELTSAQSLPKSGQRKSKSHKLKILA